QFIRYFYEWKPEKIDINWNVKPNLKNELHQALGRVALAGLDSSERFRLSESLVHKEFQNDKLFNWALDLDLLVLVDREVKTGEFVYGFFDSSFQEYFAALAIDDWDFFIPRGHVDKPVPGKKYRIFESQWKEVFLLWLGRDNLDIQEKDSLLKALINFEDGCLNIYGYRAYVLAVLGTDYYREFELADEIILTTIDIGFQYRYLVGEREKFPSPISNLAEQTICQINPQKVADKLVKIINNSEHELVWYYAAMILGKLKQKNSSIISVLTNVVEKSQHPYTRSVAAGSLGKVDPGNQIAINILMDTIENSEEEYIYSQAAIYLLEVDANNSVAIKTLVDLIFNSEPTKTQFKLFDKLITNKRGKKAFIKAAISSIKQSKQKRHYNLEWIIFYCLEKNLNIDFSQNILNLIEETDDVNTCRIAAQKISSLGKSNPIVIKKMVEFINKSESQLTSLQIAGDLIKIDSSNQYAIDTLFNILTNSDCELTQALSAWELRKIKVTDSRIPTIVKLVKNLLLNSKEEISLVMLASSLAIFEPGNSLALNTLAKLIKKSTDKADRIEVISCLLGIKKVNKKIIKALIYRIKRTTDEKVFVMGLDRLIYLSNFYPKATGFILDLLNKYEGKFYGQLIHSIVEIKSIAKQFTLPLLDKIENSDSEKLVEEATLGLAMMYENENKEELLTSLKNSYSQKNVSDNFWRFDAYYQLFWYCSQHINYPDFYNIWNEPKSTIQHLNFTQLPTTLRQHLANNPDFNQTIIPICIDGANFTNPDNPAPDIYIEMIEKGCPEITPTPTTMSSLKTYWRLNLKKLDKQIALIFYTSKSDRSFSEIFLTTLSTLGSSICLISDQKCDNIESISPQNPNLIDTIIKWLRREILEA
ncbi:MAG: HEAT repeat domain-containing protein, partial [Okeania sp. SIO2F4]|uniref:HEAT repeat domain-containing protein n=1 Tax=Okeania sp. SIO2F4 TaxID=2607790 RepID=UPI00142D1661